MDVLTEQVIDKINNTSRGESFYPLRFRAPEFIILVEQFVNILQLRSPA